MAPRALVGLERSPPPPPPPHTGRNKGGRPWVAGQAGPAGPARDSPAQPRLPGGRWTAGAAETTLRWLGDVVSSHVSDREGSLRSWPISGLSLLVKLRGAFSSPLRSAGQRGVRADGPPLVLRSLRAPAGGSACPLTRGVCPEHPPTPEVGEVQLGCDRARSLRGAAAGSVPPVMSTEMGEPAGGGQRCLRKQPVTWQ